jgi:hypothetical protein
MEIPKLTLAPNQMIHLDAITLLQTGSPRMPPSLMSDPDHIPIIPLDTGHVRLALIDGATEAVVTFEPADTKINRRNLKREGFGEAFLNRQGYSVISVMANSANWFRAGDYPRFFCSDYLRGILDRFTRVHGYGASMGAFGALAFADLLRLHTVVAYMPVSSLRADLAPWETRFEPGRALDWSGSHADGAAGIRSLRQLWAFYDPQNLDSRHADRLSQAASDRMHHIHMPGARHAVPAVLKREGLLKAAVIAALTGGSPDALRDALKGRNLASESKL